MRRRDKTMRTERRHIDIATPAGAARQEEAQPLQARRPRDSERARRAISFRNRSPSAAHRPAAGSRPHLDPTDRDRMRRNSRCDLRFESS